MFESLRETLADLLGGRIAPAERRGVIIEMKRALVQAKLGIEDLNESIAVTRRRLAAEREALGTATRRRGLAEDIADIETAAIAARYETQHAERIAMLERKLEAQEGECGLAEREYDAMVVQLKQAGAGVGAGMAPAADGPSDEDLGLPDDRPLQQELDGLARARQRSEREAGADAALEALKRRMRKE